ncbi:hypothetical protein M0638_24195 [Roseomonas sp. NAR14]|uniref:Uncharacterized protein n=1 Tax=Roseomonas acroporae TaxID=2937791 RepID=A0A9X1YC84_9PROT|nr:hypothetical protein [Roseomonas acroporae]MCK8787476.1 hypothetical protein [Roseomonas acroporae]
MLRRLLLGTALLLAATQAGSTDPLGPTMTGGGDDLQIAGRDPGHNIVGGAVIRAEGGGDDAHHVLLAMGNVQAAGPVATVSGGGENQQIVYGPALSLPYPVAAAPAGRRRPG